MIVVSDITKSFKKRIVLNKVNITVNDNELVVLDGDNGIGKSTLINLMATVITPDSGSIFIDEVDVFKDSGYKQITGFRLERPIYLNKLYPNEYFNLLQKIFKLGDEYSDRVEYLLALFGIKKKATEIENLSHGQKSKLLFIAAIAHKPKYLILDEPFEGFDKRSIEKALEEIKSLRKSQNTTILIATHTHQEELKNTFGGRVFPLTKPLL